MVVQHSSNEHLARRSVPTNAIGRFIRQRLPEEAEFGHTAEVAWLLFWARELQINLDAEIFSDAMALSSSAVAILILDLRQLDLISGSIDDTIWRQFATEEGLSSEMWLVAYEATKKNWWTKNISSKYINDHAFFKDIWTADIHFYDQKRKARPQVGPAFFSMIEALRPGRGRETGTFGDY